MFHYGPFLSEVTLIENKSEYQIFKKINVHQKCRKVSIYKKRDCRAKKIFDIAISYDEKKKVSIKFNCFMFLVRDLDAGVVGNILALLHRDLKQQVCDIGQCFFLRIYLQHAKYYFQHAKGILSLYHANKEMKKGIAQHKLDYIVHAKADIQLAKDEFQRLTRLT